MGLPLALAPGVATLVRPGTLGPADLTWQAGGLGAEVLIAGRLTVPPGGDSEGIHLVPTLPEGFAEVVPPRIERSPEEVRFALTWAAREPGFAVVAPPTVVWEDPLGLLERTLPGARPELPLERYPPELHRLRAVRLDRTQMVPGETRSRRRGTSGEFFGLREADPRDPPRLINWRASARTGRWFANEFQLDLTGDLFILVDARPTDLGPALDARLLALARVASVGIASAFLREKSRVGYASFGEFLENTVPLSTGRVQGLHIRGAIQATRTSAVAGPAERCAVGLRRFVSPGITTLVISAWNGETALELAPYLRHRNYPVLMLSPSPFALRDYAAPLPGPDEEVAARLERLVRRDHLSQLWVHAPVVDWDNLWSLEGLVRWFRRPTRTARR